MKQTTAIVAVKIVSHVYSGKNIIVGVINLSCFFFLSALEVKVGKAKEVSNLFPLFQNENKRDGIPWRVKFPMRRK